MSLSVTELSTRNRVPVVTPTACPKCTTFAWINRSVFGFNKASRSRIVRKFGMGWSYNLLVVRLRPRRTDRLLQLPHCLHAGALDPERLALADRDRRHRLRSTIRTRPARNAARSRGRVRSPAPSRARFSAVRFPRSRTSRA